MSRTDLLKLLDSWLARWQQLSSSMQFLAIVAASFCLRYVYTFVLIGPVATTDTTEYLRAAQQLLATGDFGPPIWSPGYPVAIAVISSLFGWPYAVAFYQVILSALTSGLVYQTGKAVFGPAAGLLAGLYSIGYFSLIDYSHYLLTETQFIFFLALAAFFLTDVKTISGWRLWLGGISLGLATLSRGTGLAVIPLLVLLGLSPLGLIGNWRQKITKMAVILMGIALILGPWAIRNWVRYQKFIPVASEGGYVFYLGADESWVMRRDWNVPLVQSLTGHAGLQQWDFYGPDDQGPLMAYWFRLWLTDPWAQVRFRLISFYDFWWPIERVIYPGLAPSSIYRWLGYTLLLPFVAIGSFVVVKRRPIGSYVVVAIPLGIMILQTLTYANEERLRVPASPFLILLGSYGVLTLILKIQDRQPIR